MVTEFLYGNREEKPRKKINRYHFMNVPIQQNKNSLTRRMLAKQKIQNIIRSRKRPSWY